MERRLWQPPLRPRTSYGTSHPTKPHPVPGAIGDHEFRYQQRTNRRCLAHGFGTNDFVPLNSRTGKTDPFYTFISSGPQPLRGSRQAKSLIFGSLMIWPASFSESFLPARAQRLPSWMFAAIGPE